MVTDLSTLNGKSAICFGDIPKVFPHVLVFRVGGAGKGKDLILVGSNQPLSLDLLTQRLADERIAKELRVNLRKSRCAGWFVCDETKLGPAVQGAQINTDDNMHIETTVRVKLSSR